MKKIIFSIAVMLMVSACMVEEKDSSITIGGIVTYNGAPVQSAKVCLWVGSIGSPVQTAYTDSHGRYEMVSQTDGWAAKDGKGNYFKIYVDWNDKRYYCREDYALVKGQYHNVNIPLDKW